MIAYIVIEASISHAYKLFSNSQPEDGEWSDMFDVVIVGASKPGFLTNDFLSLFFVNKYAL